MEEVHGEIIRIDVKGDKLSTPFDNFKSRLNAIQKCIVDFINNYNSKKYTIGVDFSFYIIYHSVRDLYSGNEYKFGQDYLKNENKEKLPIIHLSLFDIFADNNRIKLPEVKRYKKIVDSSIWNHYVPVFATDSLGNCTTEIDYERFHHVLQDVASNTTKGLYNLSVAEEYADLNARLLEQSHLKGSHKAISPFIFHSENELQTLIREEFKERVGLENESIVSQIKNHKWRILLIDDKADSGMSNNKKMSEDERYDSYGLPLNSKLSIIISLLDNLFVDSNHTISYGDSVSNSQNVLFSIEYAKNVSKAQDKIRNKKYDLILLDYLLEQDENNLKYGYELLEEVYKEVELIKLLNNILGVLLKESFSPYVCEIISKLIVHSDRSIKLLCKKPYLTIVKSLFSDSQSNAFIYFYSSYIQPQINAPNINRTQEEWGNIYNKILSDKELGDFIGKGGIIKAIEELIEEFSNDCYKIGPRKRMFFMFISAYSYAVHDRLLAEGLNPSEKYWFISTGACPTNTPQLFLYNLLKLMDKRLEDSGISKLSSDALYKLVNKIYFPKENDPKRESVRKRANAFYQEVLSLQYHYRSILRDVEIPFGQNSSIFDTKGSVLMTDFIQNKINLGGMLEHLTQLVHLTAFGTIRQWPEMWEEYIYFKAQFERQLDDVSIGDFNTLCQYIENYILELKSQQQ